MDPHNKNTDDIWIINGPNLNLLGVRQPELYGGHSFESFLVELRKKHPTIQINYFQSNYEGRLIDLLQDVGFSARGIILNPAAFTHTSIAIADTVAAISSPVIEVHITDIYKRESFRRISFIKEYCQDSIVGKGLKGYEEAFDILIK